MSEFYEEMKTLRYGTLTPEMKEATKAALRHFFKDKSAVVLRYPNQVISRTAKEWLQEEGFSAGNNGAFGMSDSIIVSIARGLFVVGGAVDAVVRESGTWEVVSPKVEEPSEEIESGVITPDPTTGVS